ncbi:deoxynucleoside kinase, partial [Staphylococcus saprophyticus]
IAHRNRSFEHQIADDYLLNLKRDYNDYYESLKNDGERVIRIDTTHLDFMKYENDYNYILELVKPLIGGHEHE